MRALIYAAGLGTRLRPITDTIPKAMVPVGGTPLLGHVARKLLSSGAVDSFVINTHHFPSLIADYVASNPALFPSTTISLERDRPLETGGGLLHARQYIEGEPCFIAHNVDILSNLDIAALASGRLRNGAVAQLVVSDRPSGRKLLFDSDSALVGWINVLTGETKSPYPDLDPAKYRALAFAGIHLISGRIFRVMDEYGMEGAFSIIDFYLRIADRYPIYSYEPQNLQLMDVGKIETLDRAEDFISRHPF